MRRVISLVVALVFGVGAGLGSSELWLRARVLPYCQVAENADAYHMRVVRVRAKVHFGRNGMYIAEDCDPAASPASVKFEDGPILGPTYLPDSNRPMQTKTADAIIEGEFDAKFSPGCWGPKFQIIASRIELISSPAFKD